MSRGSPLRPDRPEVRPEARRTAAIRKAELASRNRLLRSLRSTNGIALKEPGWSRSRAMKCPSSTRASSPQHLWTRENAGLFDVSPLGQLLIHGPSLSIAALETPPSW